MYEPTEREGRAGKDGRGTMGWKQAFIVAYSNALIDIRVNEFGL